MVVPVAIGRLCQAAASVGHGVGHGEAGHSTAGDRGPGRHWSQTASEPGERRVSHLEHTRGGAPGLSLHAAIPCGGHLGEGRASVRGLLGRLESRARGRPLEGLEGDLDALEESRLSQRIAHR